MPKGVEHPALFARLRAGVRIFLALMPKGVEHYAITATVAVQIGLPRLDAEGR